MSILAILGASGHGKVVADAASLTGKWREIIFFDDAWPSTHENMPWSIAGTTDHLLEQVSRFSGVVVAIGNNKIRQQKYELFASYDVPLATVVHPQAYLSPFAAIASGSVVFAQAVVNTHASIGQGSIINTGATIDHDCRLADYVHVSPGAHLAGKVSVGQRSWIGIGSAVCPGVSIADDVVVGAGATVVKSVQDNQTVVGTPASAI